VVDPSNLGDFTHGSSWYSRQVSAQIWLVSNAGSLLRWQHYDRCWVISDAVGCVLVHVGPLPLLFDDVTVVHLYQNCR
jgi:hypothetical protein